MALVAPNWQRPAHALLLVHALDITRYPRPSAVSYNSMDAAKEVCGRPTAHGNTNRTSITRTSRWTMSQRSSSLAQPYYASSIICPSSTVSPLSSIITNHRPFTHHVPPTHMSFIAPRAIGSPAKTPRRLRPLTTVYHLRHHPRPSSSSRIVPWGYHK